MSLKAAPQAVGAQQDLVALLQRDRTRDVEHRLGGRTQAGVEDVAVDAVRPDRAGVALLLDVGVVARAGEQLALAHHIQA
jgi:hypothetical protein